MESKLRECFDEMVVYKDLKRSNFFSSLGLPSFLRDWVLKKFEDDEGNYDIEEVTEFIQTYLPRKEEWISIKNRIIYENERVKILTKVGIDIDIKTGDISFSLPAFGLSNKETIIEPHVWDTYKEELTNGQETWGVIELGYRMPDDTVKPKILGKIKMTGFANFCPYVADLDFLRTLVQNLQFPNGLTLCLVRLTTMRKDTRMKMRSSLCLLVYFPLWRNDSIFWNWLPRERANLTFSAMSASMAFSPMAVKSPEQRCSTINPEELPASLLEMTLWPLTK